MSLSEKYKSHRRTVSASDACSTGSTNDNNAANSDIIHEQMLGHYCSPKTRHFIQGLSSTWSGKAPKVPQPDQTQNIFSTVMNALRDIIDLVKNDHSSLKLAADSSSVSSHQIKAAERYRKELEFHLFKLEELQERYEVQQKMREGIRSMAYAYILSRGKRRESALHNVHSGYKECNSLLCSYETKLQSMMGTFLFEMIGIQGFARMCHGDVFEIVIKHGDQKWKSRGHVLKNDKQSWENKRVLFKSNFSEPFYIKAIEVRGLGKNILLGNKYCETKDLFSAHPQQMAINLNPSGSLKLNLVITWNPVSGISEKVNTMPTRPPLFGSQSLLHYDSEINSLTRAKNPNITSQSCKRKEALENSIDSGHLCNNESSLDCAPVHESLAKESTSIRHLNNSLSSQYNESSSVSTSESLPVYASMYISNSFSQNSNFPNTQLWSSYQSAMFSSECNSSEIMSSSELSCSSSNRLQEVLYGLLTNLKNVHEQYPDLDPLYNEVLEIEKLLKFQQQSVLGSDVSISIKNALDCFDFLNTAVDGDDLDITNDRDCKTTKTPCSEKSFTTEDLDNRDNSANSFGPSPLPLTSGTEQLDLAMIAHAEYCLKLTERLCSRTPLKYYEVSSLEKLKKQAFCFYIFLKIIRENKKNEKLISCQEFFLEDEYAVKQFWIQLIGSDSITTIVEQIVPAFEKRITNLFPPSNENSNIESKVAVRVVSKMLDKITFTPETIVTVGHFYIFFSEEDSIDSCIQKIASEENLLEDIRSKKVSRISSALHLMKTISFSDALFEISYFLINEDVHMKDLAEHFLKDVAKDQPLKKQLITGYLEGLESDNSRLRQASCVSLHLLDAYDCFEQLKYLSVSDESSHVRQEAENAVLNFGCTQMRL